VYNIYCSAHHDQCSLIILSFWLHGVVGADPRPDNQDGVSLLEHLPVSVQVKSGLDRYMYRKRNLSRLFGDTLGGEQCG
jgi:hypothetical protein